jgi:hypothetical protein
MKAMMQLTMNPLTKLTMCKLGQIGDVVVGRVGFKDVESALETLKHFLVQRPIDVTPLVQSIRTLQKEIGY